MSRAWKWIASVVIALVLLIPALVVLVDANYFRGTIARIITERTGRELAINGDLQWKLDWPRIRVHAVDVTFANPPWAREKQMITAPAADVTVDLLPLLKGTLFLPEVELDRATVSFEVGADGRKNWLLDREQQDDSARAAIGRLKLRDGRVNYDDPIVDTSIAGEISSQPLSPAGTPNSKEPGIAFKANGKYLGLRFAASGTGGTLLGLRDERTPYPLAMVATVGPTTLRAEGTVAGVLEALTLDANFEVRGASLAELWDVLELPLPQTHPYSFAGRLTHREGQWRYEKFAGRIGKSDAAGSLLFTEGPPRPLVKGELAFKTLDLADLAPVVGKTGDSAKQDVSLRGPQVAQRGTAERSRALPARPFKRDRWTKSDADIQVKAQTILRPKALPLEHMTARLQMRDSVLTLDPLDFNAAGGDLVGTITLDGQHEPIHAHARLEARNLLLSKLLPTIPRAEKSAGQINGRIELVGRGDSIARMMGTADGKVGLVVDDGKISKRLMEQMAMHVPEIVLQNVTSDELIDIRCGVADFSVRNGVMQVKTLVLDTDVAKVSGSGTVDLTTEALNLTLIPRPKKFSLFALKGPISVRGDLAAPDLSVDTSRMAARGLAAAALAAINPALSLLALADTGSGKDSDCKALTAETQAPWRNTAVTQKRAPG